MGFINGLFSLLSVVCLVLLVVGLIKPSWVKLTLRWKTFGIFFGGMFVCAVIVGLTTSDEQKAQIEKDRIQAEQIKQQEQVANDQKTKPEQANTTEVLNAQETVQSQTVKEEPEESVRLTGSQMNAVRSAKDYLDMTGFSRVGLIQQLSSSYGDGYDRADATIAVDSLNVNWNEQAARSAQNYLEISGFSCNGLIQQLSSSAGDNYTKSQATYGAQKAGACS
ncbi:Ltp family lipoprotein [Acinetobacter gerneri]|uniref:Ltp family lipoprotein n=1 Tax=Acinetobacter gerneri TaxID=202952 RepID=UPI003AF53DAE